jgi:hypothetical protein
MQAGARCAERLSNTSGTFQRGLDVASILTRERHEGRRPIVRFAARQHLSRRDAALARGLGGGPSASHRGRRFDPQERMMTTVLFRSALVNLALAVTSAGVASAQPAAASLEDLKPLESTTRVTVVDMQLRRFQGTIADASESLLLLRIGSEIRRFEAAEIRSVSIRKEDSLVNGTLLGAALGGGLTSLMFLDNECRDDPVCYKAVVMYAGLGASAGLAIGALIHGTTVVYSAASRNQRPLRVVPMTGSGRRGIRVMIGF